MTGNGNGSADLRLGDVVIDLGGCRLVEGHDGRLSLHLLLGPVLLKCGLTGETEEALLAVLESRQEAREGVPA